MDGESIKARVAAAIPPIHALNTDQLKAAGISEDHPNVFHSEEDVRCSLARTLEEMILLLQHKVTILKNIEPEDVKFLNDNEIS